MAPYLCDEWLEFEKSLDRPRFILKGTPEEIIVKGNSLLHIVGPHIPPRDASVSSYDDIANGVPVRIYRPQASTPGSLPVGVFFHGGGWIAGNLEAQDHFCRQIALAVPSIIVSVDYRLGPKYKMPVLIQDCFTAYQWAFANVEKYGGNKSKFYTIGSSAGGCLALTTANKLVANPETRSSIHGVVALVPPTTHPDNVPSEYNSMYKSYTENADDAPIIDRSSMETYFEAIDANPEDSSMFTILSKNHAHFPPTYISTCGADPLRDDGVIMIAALKKAGVATKYENYVGMPHSFWTFPQLESSSKFLKNTLHGVPPYILRYYTREIGNCVEKERFDKTVGMGRSGELKQELEEILKIAPIPSEL